MSEFSDNKGSNQNMNGKEHEIGELVINSVKEFLPKKYTKKGETGGMKKHKRRTKRREAKRTIERRKKRSNI